MMCAAASTSAAGRWPRAEHTEQRHHDDGLDVDVAEAARSQVARHAAVGPSRAAAPTRPGARGPGARRRPRRAASRPRWPAPRGSGGATAAARRCPLVHRRRRHRGSPRAPSVRAPCPRGEDARELVLVPEVSVEGAMGDTGRGDEVVDARVVVAAVDEHVTTRGEQGDERAVPRTRRVERLVALSEQLEHLGTELERRRRRTLGRVHVHVGADTEQRAMQHVGDGILDRSLGYAAGAADRRMPVTSSVWLRHSRRSRITGSSWRGGSVVVTKRSVDPRDDLLAGAPRDGREAPRRSPARGRPARSARGSRRTGRPTLASLTNPRRRG